MHPALHLQVSHLSLWVRLLTPWTVNKVVQVAASALCLHLLYANLLPAKYVFMIAGAVDLSMLDQAPRALIERLLRVKQTSWSSISTRTKLTQSVTLLMWHQASCQLE